MVVNRLPEIKGFTIFCSNKDFFLHLEFNFKKRMLANTHTTGDNIMGLHPRRPQRVHWVCNAALQRRRDKAQTRDVCDPLWFQSRRVWSGTNITVLPTPPSPSHTHAPLLFPAEAEQPVPAKTEDDNTEKSAAVEMEGTMRFRLRLIWFDLARLRVWLSLLFHQRNFHVRRGVFVHPGIGLVRFDPVFFFFLVAIVLFFVFCFFGPLFVKLAFLRHQSQLVLNPL